MSIKSIFKHKLTLAWFITSCVLLFLLLVLNIAFAIPTVQDFANLYIGQAPTQASGDTESKQYYKKETDSKEAAKEAGEEFNITAASEGIVMLKNKDNAFPIAKGSKVSVFGKNSVEIVYGGSGSGAVDTSEAKTIQDSLTAVGLEVNPTLWSFYKNDSASGAGRPENPSDLDTGATVSLTTGESPYSSYTQEVKNSYSSYNDLALVVFSRIGGEGFDLPRTSDEEGKHYLELDANEIELLRNVTSAGFKKVAVIINSGNAMELGFAESGEFADKIDGLFLMPGTGTTGVMALGQILTGEVNPSGHTVDTYATDFTADPTWNNFGDNRADHGDELIYDGENYGYYFVDYEENVYVGYRYYETRGADDESWYSSHVVYPFGYGLSYTTFSMKFADDNSFPTELSKDKFTVKVEVENTGDVAGKEVVEIYGHAPYKAGEIEKPEIQLLGFAKTPLIEPNSDPVTVEIEIDPYYLASYDYKDANKDGIKGYQLDSGEYTFSLRSDAHTMVDSFDVNLSNTISYEKDPVTDNNVVNRYTDLEDATQNSDFHLQTLLSRNNWDNTWPQTPTTEDRTTTKEVIDALDSRDHNNPNNYTEMPTQGDTATDPDLMLYSLFKMNTDGSTALNEYGAPYITFDNEKWDALLNKVTNDEMKNTINRAMFNTASISSIDKPKTNDTDGPAGFVNFMSPKTFYGTCAYNSEVLFAMTWNVDILREFGAHVGEEGLWGDANGDKLPYSGWYAPGLNIHRSPFGGRNNEYFSEDPLLSGKLAAAEIQGAQSKGVYCFVKHFALNEQETHRQSNGDISSVTEQAMREIFLRGFEIAVKEGKTTAMMTSFNRIGTKWAGGDYRLLTEILRNEWGFKGTVIDDFNTPGYMSVKQMVYAGGDINLSGTRFWNNVDYNDPNDVTVLRNAMKNLLYTVGNSCAMNGHGEGVIYTEGLAPWRIIQIVYDVVAVLVILGWGIPSIMYVYKKEKQQQVAE